MKPPLRCFLCVNIFNVLFNPYLVLKKKKPGVLTCTLFVSFALVELRPIHQRRRAQLPSTSIHNVWYQRWFSRRRYDGSACWWLVYCPSPDRIHWRQDCVAWCCTRGYTWYQFVSETYIQGHVYNVCTSSAITITSCQKERRTTASQQTRAEY